MNFLIHGATLTLASFVLVNAGLSAVVLANPAAYATSASQCVMRHDSPVTVGQRTSPH